jgi:hypothetical protein
VAREGFTELVTRVCSGDVGAIFGIEITRLARSNADVARLAEFARITGTLLIDPDGVYDPADVNDRVLLGFKGTMGEALCRCRHRTSYADAVVMPTRHRGCGLRLERQRGFIGIIPLESWLALCVLSS